MGDFIVLLNLTSGPLSRSVSLVKYVIDSCVLCVDNNKTKSIEKVLLVKVWLTKNMSSH